MAWKPAPPITAVQPQRTITWVLDAMLLMLLPTVLTGGVLFGVQATKRQSEGIAILDGVGGALVATAVVGVCYAVLLSTRFPRGPRIGVAVFSLAMLLVFLAMPETKTPLYGLVGFLAPTFAGAVVVVAILLRTVVPAWTKPVGAVDAAVFAVPLAGAIWVAMGTADVSGVDTRVGPPSSAENLDRVTRAGLEDWYGRLVTPPILTAPRPVLAIVAVLAIAVGGGLYALLVNRRLAPGGQLVAAGLFVAATAWSTVDSLRGGGAGATSASVRLALETPAGGDAIVLAAPLVVVAVVRIWRSRRARPVPATGKV
jgi:hypothetical protein